VSQLSHYTPQFLVIGCYTQNAGGDGVGLTVAGRDPDTGALWPIGDPTPTPSPSSVIRHPTLPVLYSVNELPDDGGVSAFGMSDDATLTPWGTWPTGGGLPCYLTVDPDVRYLLVTNYGTGSVATFALDADGRPTGRADLVAHKGSGPHPERQEGPHAHHVTATANGVFVADLGVDAIFRYRLDPETGELTDGEVAASLPAGTGPRHAAVAPTGVVYLDGELAANVIALRPQPQRWAIIGSVPSTTAPRESAMPSEIAVSSDGRWLYVANRGPATLAVFSLADEVPTLVGEVPTGGSWPRHFVLVEPFLYVANQLSHTVTVFRVDPATGLPSPTGEVLATPSPTCLLPVSFSDAS
jgi:6-phosphogluconolactonase